MIPGHADAGRRGVCSLSITPLCEGGDRVKPDAIWPRRTTTADVVLGGPVERVLGLGALGHPPLVRSKSSTPAASSAESNLDERSVTKRG